MQVPHDANVAAAQAAPPPASAGSLRVTFADAAGAPQQGTAAAAGCAPARLHTALRSALYSSTPGASEGAAGICDGTDTEGVLEPLSGGGGGSPRRRVHLRQSSDEAGDR